MGFQRLKTRPSVQGLKTQWKNDWDDNIEFEKRVISCIFTQLYDWGHEWVASTMVLEERHFPAFFDVFLKDMMGHWWRALTEQQVCVKCFIF